MKSFTQLVNEKLVINKDTKFVEMKYPTDRNELIDIIIAEVRKYNGGTIRKPIDLNFISFDKWNFDDSYKSNIKMLFNYVVTMLKDDRIKLYAVDISRWDVSKFDTFDEMFIGCKNLKTVGDISGWNVSNVKSMNGMFMNCIKLEHIGDISKWDISSCTNFSFMFGQCEKLEKLDLDAWGNKFNKIVIDDRSKYHCMTSGTRQPIWSWMKRK